ncbi:MAG TPA: cob(I)yrinic acid a,c-diamide adenosyltransferase [Thermomicrobiaceae bacterium]|nr:cob(I)yrinic acid a,c-diamide adenosyltransferase [Thermomicrobiaceae bacterium]
MSQETTKNGQEARSYLMLLVGDERATSDAALGIALRASGYSLRVHIIEFQKTGRERGEVVAASLLTGLSLTQYGTLSSEQTPTESNDLGTTAERAEAAMREAGVHVRQRVTNILILDGVLSLIKAGLVSDDAILDLVDRAAPWLDIVATGLEASERLKKSANSLTLMETIKETTHAVRDLRRGIHY